MLSDYHEIRTDGPISEYEHQWALISEYRAHMEIPIFLYRGTWVQFPMIPHNYRLSGPKEVEVVEKYFVVFFNKCFLYMAEKIYLHRFFSHS